MIRGSAHEKPCPVYETPLSQRHSSKFRPLSRQKTTTVRFHRRFEQNGDFHGHFSDDLPPANLPRWAQNDSALTENFTSPATGQFASPPQWPDFDGFDDHEIIALAAAFQRASPFPHLVIDGFFPVSVLASMVRDFDAAIPSDWHEYHGSLQNKRGTPPEGHLPDAVQAYFNMLYSGPFLRLLSRITGIANLIPDPALHGGGMHEVEAGGGFEVHVDFTKHPRTRLNNRLVVITYLNEGWGAADGGALELWSINPPRPGVKLLPIFGRTVIMAQSANAAHGQPEPVRAGSRRRSAVAYFYTNGLGPDATGAVLDTVYIPHAGHSRRQRAELLLRRLTPSSVIKGLKAVRGVFNL